ncbi:BREX-1 system adenine-specific DNA-methyltransferase PglX [Phaeobacter sp. J2-8]|uniref:BREX-1 system adenine-specific DNA-methyltransferase PglX n=1 Tax=Phaeobacter sp. J2-8 TaxID=2931394 RepID=UPI0032AFDD0E
MVSTAAFLIQTSADLRQKGDYFRLTSGMSEAEKSKLLLDAKSGNEQDIHFRVSGQELEKIPGDPFAYWVSNRVREIFEKSETLGSLGAPTHGVVTGDNDRFLRQWFEVATSQSNMEARDRPHAKSSGAKWFPVSKGGSYRRWHGNLEFFIDWENDGHVMRTTKHSTGRIRATNFNLNRIFQPGITWSTISNTLAMRYLPDGMLFESKGSVCFCDDEDTRLYLLALTNSKVVNALLLIMSPTLDYHEGPMSRVPVVDMEHERPVAIAGTLRESSKSDWDAYETSWDFTTLPLLSPDHRGNTLEATYATLRTHWQSMTEEMQRLEEENNRIFIDAYGLQDELTPEVPIEEITLTCNPAYRYGVKGNEADRETRLRADTMAELLSYAVGCMFGRYSLDAPGLILANQGERMEDYLARIPEPSFMPDEDNVIPVLDENWFSDDITERFRLFLRVSFGEAHFRENLKFIEDSLGKDIRKYFTKDFYADHVKRYKKRPIYWMVSSPKGTFNALIYMHRYRADTVSVLLNDYLREFITKLEGERARLEKLADDPTATQGQRTKALKQVGVVAKQIDELHEWEREVIFPLAQQKIEIDLDDGVKANYPKFGKALKKIPGLS